MKIIFGRKVGFFCLILLCFSCQNSGYQAQNKEVISIVVSNSYILIEDKSYLLKDFEKGYSNIHKEKLKSIFPDTLYQVQLEVGEGTKLDKIMFVKDILKKHQVLK